MPKDDINYRFTENGIVYDFYDVFVPAENFRQPSLFVWGAGDQGRLGTNNGGQQNNPVTTFAGGTNWKSVFGGNSGTIAIKTDGTLWVWGRGDSGELGNNTNTNRSTPVTTFAGGNNWKSLSSSGYTGSYNAAIKTDGSLWTWGSSLFGMLGTNNTTTRSTPVTTFAGGNNWKSLACGGGHMGAIKTDGTLWMWGQNGTIGALGINFSATDNHRNTPVTTFAGGNNWKQVSCGSQYTAAIKTDGSLWTWGFNANGKLGDNTTITRSTPVTTFAGGNDWKQVSCGLNHTAAIKTDGSLWVWGLNGNGRLGTNDTNTRTTPVTTFTGGNNWKQVSCGGQDHTAAIKTDGTLWTWGRNNFGQLGNISFNVDRSIPSLTTAGGNNWKSVSAGGNHTVAVKSGLNVDLS